MIKAAALKCCTAVTVQKTMQIGPHRMFSSLLNFLWGPLSFRDWTINTSKCSAKTSHKHPAFSLQHKDVKSRRHQTDLMRTPAEAISCDQEYFVSKTRSSYYVLLANNFHFQKFPQEHDGEHVPKLIFMSTTSAPKWWEMTTEGLVWQVSFEKDNKNQT